MIPEGPAYGADSTNAFAYQSPALPRVDEFFCLPQSGFEFTGVFAFIVELVVSE